MNKLNKYLKLVLAACLLLPGIASAVEGQTLGLSIEHPQINSGVDTSLACGFDGATLRLQSSASNIQFVSGGSFTTIFGNNTGTVLGGLVDISAPIDSSGNLQAGATLTVTGYYQDSSLGIRGPTLLTADITNYGILDGAVDTAEFEISVTGGDASTDPDWAFSQDGGVIVALNNSNYAGSSSATGFDVSWACDSSKSTTGLTPDGGTAPFDCYAVNTVKIKDKSGTNKDEIKVSKGGFRLDAPNTVDLNVDDVTITVGSYSVTIPAGSFVEGKPGDFKFKTASGAVPKIQARMNFTKATWELKVKGADASSFAAGVPIDVTLTINGFSNTENVTLSIKGGSKGSKNGSKGSAGASLEYKAKPKRSCALSGTSDTGTPGPGKLSCISEMTVQHTSGEFITKTMVAAELLHPNTVFSDSVNNDLGIFHTSCSKCLECGAVDGNFTVVRILGSSGDKLAQKCMVPDASCNIIP